MKRFLVFFLIFFLILFTAIIKNSTKRIDDEIFAIKENVRSLKKIFGNTKLEYEFLSSAEKLLEYQDQYFDEMLIEKKIQNIKVINQNSNKFEIEEFKFTNE